MGGGGLYPRGIITRIEKGIQNKARVVRVKICFVLIFMVFNQALKHHNNSNSFPYKPKGGLSLDVFFCLQVDGLVSRGGVG